ncbi:DUF3331 domain-containing protein [Paraburkholderia sp. BCC1884]|uniref:DUF3331 domain-containing protein n=1 Tax=Paraburkholderia sp. BCC1884 TaxID=2562668 RepID=UPI001182DF45|nr:DUF3331 domain-containing protein [Paraburkholderia sp. BCC1884]
MQIETPLKQRPDAVRQEARMHHESYCSPRDNAAPLLDTRDALDAGRAPVWDHVINRLLAGYRSEAEGEAYLKRPVNRAAMQMPSLHVQIEVIERLSESSIAVLWQDATRCRYVDQVWISCRARVKGRCAVSGAPIRRDDAIYKPRVRSAVPANAGAMILASVIEVMAAVAWHGDVR